MFNLWLLVCEAYGGQCRVQGSLRGRISGYFHFNCLAWPNRSTLPLRHARWEEGSG